MTDLEAIALGCLLLGAYLLIYAVRALRAGSTQGYYSDHTHARGEKNSRYGIWVWFRFLLGSICLICGALYLTLT